MSYLPWPLQHSAQATALWALGLVLAALLPALLARWCARRRARRWQESLERSLGEATPLDHYHAGGIAIVDGRLVSAGPGDEEQLEIRSGAHTLLLEGELSILNRNESAPPVAATSARVRGRLEPIASTQSHHYRDAALEWRLRGDVREPIQVVLRGRLPLRIDGRRALWKALGGALFFVAVFTVAARFSLLADGEPHAIAFVDPLTRSQAIRQLSEQLELRSGSRVLETEIALAERENNCVDAAQHALYRGQFLRARHISARCPHDGARILGTASAIAGDFAGALAASDGIELPWSDEVEWQILAGNYAAASELFRSSSAIGPVHFVPPSPLADAIAAERDLKLQCLTHAAAVHAARPGALDELRTLTEDVSAQARGYRCSPTDVEETRRAFQNGELSESDFTAYGLSCMKILDQLLACAQAGRGESCRPPPALEVRPGRDAARVQLLSRLRYGLRPGDVADTCLLLLADVTSGAERLRALRRVRDERYGCAVALLTAEESTATVARVASACEHEPWANHEIGHPLAIESLHLLGIVEKLHESSRQAASGEFDQARAFLAGRLWTIAVETGDARRAHDLESESMDRWPTASDGRAALQTAFEQFVADGRSFEAEVADGRVEAADPGERIDWFRYHRGQRLADGDAQQSFRWLMSARRVAQWAGGHGHAADEWLRELDDAMQNWLQAWRKREGAMLLEVLHQSRRSAI